MVRDLKCHSSVLEPKKKKEIEKLEKLCETMVFRPQGDLRSYTTLILERTETNEVGEF